MALSDFDLVFFGGSGDLAMRKLLPAMYARDVANDLPATARIICVGREDMSQEAFLRMIETNSKPHVKETVDEAAWQAFLQRITYVEVDAGNVKSYAALVDALRKDESLTRVYYLATPPQLFARICDNLAKVGLATPNSRVVLEKPLGRDLASAKQINLDVGKVFAESQIYRIDHYLGKETVQNLLALRFGNVLFEPLWRREWISDVQITIAEKIGVGNRLGYYDNSGALRDMLQNHMLQLLCLVAMEPPSDLDPDSVRNEKVKVLRSLRPVTVDEVERVTVRGQYVAGVSEGKPAKGYDEERGQPSDTETFVAVRADIDNWRWAGVPFFMRTGKRLPEKRTEIVIQFKPVPHSIFDRDDRGEVQANRMIIELQPEEDISLTVMNKRPGLDQRMQLQPIKMSLSWGVDGKSAAPPRRRIAYERLLLDAMAGDSTLFVRRDEAEQAWKWVDEVSEAWAESGLKPDDYVAGTWGPDSADMLMARTGRDWNTTDV